MNIIDYLIWRGDLPFENYPFNEIDSLILSRLSYLPFEKIKIEDGDTLQIISTKMKKIKEYRIQDDKKLIELLGKSSRFQKLKISDFYINKSREFEKQFGAITIHLKEGIYISYIGTDNSIIGWKEDFNLSFLKHIPAQIEGVKYINEVSQKYRGSIRVGGHSKGGNIAIYSSLYSDKTVSNRIISVNNFDGPGFDISVISESKNKQIIDKTVTYIPQDSVIGRVLEHKEKSITVKSNNKGLYQHDIYSWEIIKDTFVKCSLTDSSEFINQTIKTWLLNTNSENRKVFVDSIFELFFSSNSESFHELSKTWIKDIPLMFNAYKDISKKDRKVITQMIKEFARSSSSVLKNIGKEKLEKIENNLLE